VEVQQIKIPPPSYDSLPQHASLKPEEWDKYLPIDDPKRAFIMEGVTLGFKLSDLDKIEPKDRVLVKNYYSCFKYRHAVEMQILQEIENGRYIFSKTQPKIVSALGAIPKKSGGIRLIHDCSKPSGFAVNDEAIKESFQYQTLQDAIKMISPGDFMGKVDLQSAYRSVRVSPAERERLGISWTFEGALHPSFLLDCSLPFGHSRSPFIFNELSQAVCRIMKSFGYELVMAYLDDFLVAGKTFSACKEALDFLIWILRRLGFAISYPKVEGPKQRIIFLGFLINSLEMTVALTRDRISELNELLAATLKSHKITKKKLQSIIGKLNYCTQVVYGGRFFLRRLINIVTSLVQPWHRVRVTREMRADINWWLSFGLIFCSKPLPMVQEVRPCGNSSLCIDACSRAAGAFFMADSDYTEFSDYHKDAPALCINYKEVIALLPAVKKWAPYFQNKLLHVYSDNQCAVGIINKGSCKDPLVMESLREVFWYSVMYNFRIKCHWYPGIRNSLADAVSRLHEASGVLRFNKLLASWYQTNAFNSSCCTEINCLCHH